jgi:hypothetical protein
MMSVIALLADIVVAPPYELSSVALATTLENRQH